MSTTRICEHDRFSVEEGPGIRCGQTGYYDDEVRVTCHDCGEVFTEDGFEREMEAVR